VLVSNKFENIYFNCYIEPEATSLYDSHHYFNLETRENGVIGYD